jgi:hypothetical protein
MNTFFSRTLSIFNGLLLLCGVNGLIFGMEPKVDNSPAEVRIINLTNEDLTIFPYRSNPIKKVERNFLIIKPSTQLKTEQETEVNTLKAFSKYEWYTAITTQSQQAFPKDAFPTPRVALNLSEGIQKLMDQKPWLANRTIYAIIKNNAVRGLARLAGYTSAGIDLFITDVNPLSNPDLKRQIDKTHASYTINNQTADSMAYASYRFDADSDTYIIRHQKKIGAGEASLVFFGPQDRLILTKYKEVSQFPLFNPITGKILQDITPTILKDLQDNPSHDGAKLTIAVTSKAEQYDITIQPSDDNNILALPLPNWYDITHVDSKREYAALVQRTLYYNSLGASLAAPHAVMLYVSHEGETNPDTFKISSPIMQAIMTQAMQFSAQLKMPIEIAFVRWSGTHSDAERKNGGAHMGQLLNKVYNSEDLYPFLITIGDRDGGNVALIATRLTANQANRAKPRMDAMVQLLVPTILPPADLPNLYTPAAHAFARIYNIYEDPGTGIQRAIARQISYDSGGYLDESPKPCCIYNLATTYVGNASITNPIMPALTHIQDIISFTLSHYRINTLLKLVIDTQNLTSSGVYIYIDKIRTNTNADQSDINQEQQTSFAQKGVFAQKFPASIGQQAARVLQTGLETGAQYATTARQTLSDLYKTTQEQVPAALETAQEASRKIASAISSGAEALGSGIGAYFSKLQRPKPEDEVEMEPAGASRAEELEKEIQEFKLINLPLNEQNQKEPNEEINRQDQQANEDLKKLEDELDAIRLQDIKALQNTLQERTVRRNELEQRINEYDTEISQEKDEDRRQRLRDLKKRAGELITAISQSIQRIKTEIKSKQQ